MDTITSTQIDMLNDLINLDLGEDLTGTNLDQDATEGSENIALPSLDGQPVEQNHPIISEMESIELISDGTAGIPISLNSIELSNPSSELSNFSSNNDSGFQVLGTKIYDPNGQEFIAKGANVFTWDGTNNIDNYLDVWNFNTIRVPNYLLGSWNQPHPGDDDYATNRAIVDAYTQRGVTVIFDAHDLIGSYYEGEDFETLKEHWRRMAQEFKDNPYVWFNLHNEPGNKNPQHEKWTSYHRELIDVIRNEGAQNTIVIDGETWGQDYQTHTILNQANEVMEGNENIVFSLHIYKQWGDGSEIGGYIDQLHDEGIPVIIGEYGDTAAINQMMQALQEREVGRLAWVAMAADQHDFTTGNKGHAWHYDGTNPEILTDFGQLILEDLQREENLEKLGETVSSNNFFISESEIASSEINIANTDLFDHELFEAHSTDIDHVSNGNASNNRLRGSKNNDILYGFGGNDTLIGRAGNDILFGHDGNDRLFGGSGHDQLQGGDGDDILRGGRGRDSFWIDLNSGTDTIRDFMVTEDQIVLGRQIGIHSLSLVQGTGQYSKDTFLTLDNQQQVLAILSDVDTDTLTEANFTVF